MKNTTFESAKNSSSFASTESAAKTNLYKVDHIYYEDLDVFYVEKTDASIEAYWTLKDEDLAEKELGGEEAPVIYIKSKNYRDIWAR